MSVTVAALHKALGKMIEEGHGRKKVCIDKSTFRHPLESDGAVILEIAKVTLESYPMLDDDGFTKFRADGSESCHTNAVIAGDFAER